MSCNALKPLLLAAALLAASVSHALPKDGVVYTVNYPLQFFAEAIGGDDLEIVFPAPPDVDPADWTPDVDTLIDYQAADLILLNGAGYAEWTKGVYLARSRLLDTSASFKDRLIAEESDEAPHVHGPTGAEVQGAAVAFTTWLDLSLARAQAEAVRDAMAARWPDHAEAFAERHERLDADLAILDAKLSDALAPLHGRRVLASHPVYQYLERRYGLDLISFHWEPNQMPPPEEWAVLDDLLDERVSTIMLWEGEPTPETREALEARGLRVVVLPTLSNRPSGGDFVSILRAAIDAL
jgi:zinc transport system substrate-binding protein